MHSKEKFSTSLRAKIFNQLSKIKAADVSQAAITLPPEEPKDSNSDSEDDSVGSLADHLVRLEDIDLDSQFYSQPFSDTPGSLQAVQETQLKEEISDVDSECETQNSQRVSIMLTQLNDFERNCDAAKNLSSSLNSECNANISCGRHDEIAQVICDHEFLQSTDGAMCIDGNFSEDEWEPIHGFTDKISTESIEVIVSQPPKNISKVLDVEAQLKKLLQDERREKQLLLHKTHLLCLLSYGFYLNRLANELVQGHQDDILRTLYGVSNEVPEHMDLKYLRTICDMYRKNNGFEEFPLRTSTSKNTSNIAYMHVSSKEAFVILFTAVLRFMCIEARLVMHLNVLSKSLAVERRNKHPTLPIMSNTAMSRERYPNVPLTTAEILKRKPELIHFSQIPQMDGADDEIVAEKRPRLNNELDTRPKLWKLKKINNSITKVSSMESVINQRDIKSKTGPATKSSFFKKSRKTQDKTKKERQDISPSNRADQLPQQNERTIWVEVFLPAEKRWLVIDILLPDKIDCLDHVVKMLSHPLPAYVFGWSNDNTLHDVSARYWWNNETGARRLRVMDKWLLPVLRNFGRKRKTLLDLIDMREFKQLRFRAPIPEKVSEFKNHPSYCLKRDLLKFQAIYPPEAPPLGFFRDEPIYARECVHTLHSREVWLRHAKVIRLYERPYKVVMSKLKREKTELELFGYWQTEEYVPPEPENGRVPRNAYGNIEIFKDCMLPKGTVHLKQINISKICRKMNVDYATAVVGFGVHAGGNHPVFDGIVICKEFEQRVLEEYEREKVEQELRKHQRREKTIYDNWKRLIRGLLVRNRLKCRYNFDNL
ncbi:uncharacterized protein LOC131684791 [Topomyia yanbarensis]|uniref:uncharacterized protein LOC131684791 n=1 Tax=Topomyia yanbarensis TaxID=2498891 RepID=UPI00273B0C1F|nr:uncharacterized protein LOC131684791 [Topomyia yanbarensis]